MAFYTPHQRADGTWDYTCTNSAGTFALGYCSAYAPLTNNSYLIRAADLSQEFLDRENARTLPFKHKYHSTGHRTASAAVNCYREYRLDQHLMFDEGTRNHAQLRCGICKRWTTGSAHIFGEFFHSWPLCIAHQTRRAVEELWPMQAEVTLAVMKK